MYSKFFKRLFDFTLSTIVFGVFSPLLLALTIFLVFANSGKVFFSQDRLGKQNKIFSLIKFKTMNNHRDATGNLLPDKDCITPMGRFMHSSSPDELLQLINGPKGELSLVGARDLLVKYLPLYTPEQARR